MGIGWRYHRSSSRQHLLDSPAIAVSCHFSPADPISQARGIITLTKHPLPVDKPPAAPATGTAGAPDPKAEVTPEMVRAAISAMGAYFGEDGTLGLAGLKDCRVDRLQLTVNRTLGWVIPEVRLR